MGSTVKLSVFTLPNGFVGGRVTNAGPLIIEDAELLYPLEPGERSKEQAFGNLENYCDMREWNIRQYADEGILSVSPFQKQSII